MFKVEEIRRFEQEIIDFRRDFHMHPELGFEEVRTSEIVANALQGWGLEVTRGIGKTGVIGILKGKEGGRTVALRADMDALPMQEENQNIPYKSKIDGKMHACGHDAHTAMLLGAAKVLSENREKVNGTIKFIFQPAEEGPAPGGGSYIVGSGALDDVDAAFAIHVGPSPCGELGIHAREASAATDFFEIKVIGTGGHGSAPHMSVDPIVIAAQIVGNLQNIITRETDATESAVLSICSINGGEAFNVIPEVVTMTGTVRTLNEEVREKVFDRMASYVKGITMTYNADYEFNRGKGYPSLTNNEDIVQLVHEVGSEMLGKDKVTIFKKALMGGEDFAYYTQKVPGVIAWLGNMNSDKDIVGIPHNPKFDIDEDCLALGTCLHANFALKVLNQEKGE